MPSIVTYHKEDPKGVFMLTDENQVGPMQAYLKSIANNHKISVVILGGSRLGMEYATSLRRTFPEVSVTVLDHRPIPMLAKFGPEICRQLMQ